MWERTLFQRPQQVMTCLQRLGRPVAYLSSIGTRRWLRTLARRGGARPALAGTTPEGLRFATLPYTPLCFRLGLARRVDYRFRALAAWALSRGGGAAGPRVLWLTHPDLVGQVDRIRHDLLVYDAMDPFDAFAASLAGAREREQALLERADVVFSGGRSMHERIAPRRSDALCLPSGVEVEHFARALAPETAPAEELRDAPGPVVGYIGAVDERMDWDLIDAVCRRRPDWTFALIGPLVGMARCPATAPNCRYLGARDYGRLPEYLKAMDVATIPWVVNDLTVRLSPTKTPEYLAAGRPVVSAAIPDVERDYGDVVAVARGAEAFVAACERALDQGADGAAARARALAERARDASWEAVAGRMDGAIVAALGALQ